VKRWTPAQPNGWNPTISPDGAFVACGFGHVYAHDLSTGATLDCGDGWPAGWRDAHTLGITSSIDGHPDARAFRWVSLPDLSAAVVSLPAETMPMIAAGAVFGGRETGPGVWSYWRDGQALPIAGAWGGPSASSDGRYLLLARPADAWRPAVWDAATGALVRALPSAVTDARVWSGPDGAWVTFNRGGRAWVSTPDGDEFVVASHVDEYAGALVWVNGVPWAWTWAGLGANEQYVVMGRPLGQRDAVCVEMPGLGLSVSLVGQTWRLAAQDNRGRLTLVTDLPLDAARRGPRSLVTPFDWPMPSTDWTGAGWGWLGGEADSPGTLTSGADTTTGRPIVEAIGTNADGSPWIRPQDYGRLAAIFVSPADSRNWIAERDAALDLARFTGAAVLVYDDHPDTLKSANGELGAFNRWAEVRWFQERGAAVIIGLQAYPTEGDNSWQVTNWHEPDCHEAARRGLPVVLIQAGYTQSGRWMLRTCAGMLDATDDLARRNPNVIGTLLFGWRRGAEPAEWTAWITRRCAALASRGPVDLSSWPRTARVEVPAVAPEPAPAPTPDPTPTPEPAPPTRQPKKGQPAWVAGLPFVAAAVTGLVKWLRRKK
jgi:hypothetical protein